MSLEVVHTDAEPVKAVANFDFRGESNTVVLVNSPPASPTLAKTHTFVNHYYYY